MTDLLIHDATVVTVNRENQILKNGSIRVTDGTISSVEPTDPADRDSTAEHVIDASGKIVIPGLIDAHRHTDFTLVQGLFSELDGSELLKEAFALYHTAEPTLGESFFEAAWELACLRQLTHGVTTVNAMDFTPELGAEAVGESGVRGVIGPELADFVNPASASEQLADARRFIDTYHDSYEGRVTASIAPGGEAGCSRELWEGVAELRADYPDLRLHTHLYDSAEADTMAAGSGADDPLDLLDRYGLLDERTLLTHLLHANRDDARRIADAGAHVLHCPTVYSYFQAGNRTWFPLPALREFDANVVIGLDDPFWFDSWDLIQEAKHARMLSNFQYGAQQWSSYDLLEMLTIDAARALGLDDQIGSLEPGKRADLAIIDVDTPRHQPYSNLPSVLTNSVTAGDVETVVVDGEVLMEERAVRSMDVERVRTAATRERERLQTRTGWETSLAGSTPPKKSILRRVSARPLLRAMRQYGRGVVNQHNW
ncbi:MULTISPECIES: amidohydrolase family protein [Halolamina]|uniref:5-methylthioadenosine/S-adenosylhomocysteine deaminase n=1 Tax=Halolamina pelagica TaxID=699431 RepID=A0A1I5NW84_9EURY|nr:MULTISPECIES: amidohydrolase family protein [Halolamina]NHX36503.1 amidohydrolase family protein [Halolamina sp. R1-12]SFP25890.1 5-methylthioadenosine/S-adenosylhomocysteine deaminase [Halolamina pelagica]